MDVEHALPGVAPGVEDQAVRPVEGVIGERLGDLDHMRELRGIGAGQLGDVRVMVLGYDEHMDRRLGADVLEGIGRLVLLDLLAGNLAGDDLAEQAIGLAHHDPPG